MAKRKEPRKTKNQKSQTQGQWYVIPESDGVVSDDWLNLGTGDTYTPYSQFKMQLPALDSTTADPDASAIPAESSEPKSWAAFLFRLVDGKFFLLPLFVIGVYCAKIYIDDNAAGNQKSWQDLLWTLQKCIIPSAVLGVISFLIWLRERARG